MSKCHKGWSVMRQQECKHTDYLYQATGDYRNHDRDTELKLAFLRNYFAEAVVV